MRLLVVLNVIVWVGVLVVAWMFLSNKPIPMRTYQWEMAVPVGRG